MEYGGLYKVGRFRPVRLPSLPEVVRGSSVVVRTDLAAFKHLSGLSGYVVHVDADCNCIQVRVKKQFRMIRCGHANRDYLVHFESGWKKVSCFELPSEMHTITVAGDRGGAGKDEHSIPIFSDIFSLKFPRRAAKNATVASKWSRIASYLIARHAAILLIQDRFRYVWNRKSGTTMLGRRTEVNHDLRIELMQSDMYERFCLVVKNDPKQLLHFLYNVVNMILSDAVGSSYPVSFWMEEYWSQHEYQRLFLAWSQQTVRKRIKYLKSTRQCYDRYLGSCEMMAFKVILWI